MHLAGLRKHRVRFERRASVDDGAGNTLGAWQAVTTAWCACDTERTRGVEALEAGRLESSANWRLTVPKSTTLATITPEDRAVFVVGPHAGVVANIRWVESSAENREIIMDIALGVAV